MSVLPTDAANRAADIFAAARRDLSIQLQPLPVECRPESAEAAYDVQIRLHECLQADFGPKVGYKIGCTTQTMQNHLGIDEPCFGHLREREVADSGVKNRFADFHAPGVECEIAVRVGSDLPGLDRPYTREEAAVTVDSMMAAIEIVDNRYQDLFSMGAWSLAADDFVSAGGVLGRPVTPDRIGDLEAMAGVLSVDGVEIARGLGRDVLGHPFAALQWLANALPPQGLELKAGDVVLMGSVVQVVWLDGPGAVTVVFEGLGAVEATFA